MKEAPPPAVPTSGPSPAAAPACKAAAPPADPLHDPTPLTAQQIESYQRNGFIKLKVRVLCVCHRCNVHSWAVPADQGRCTRPALPRPDSCPRAQFSKTCTCVSLCRGC